MQNKGILLSGPGTHITHLSAALRKAQRLYAVIHHYPSWEMEFDDGTRKRLLYYRILTWGMWAMWRRIPYWGKWDYPKTWHAALYDWLAARHVLPSLQFVWGWSGNSLFTLQKARRYGLRTFLEFPTVHPVVWRAIIHDVCSQLSIPPTGLMHIPLSYISRMEKEIKYADKVITLSSFAKQTLIQQGVPAEKLHWIPLGVEENLFTPAPYLSRRPFRLLYVGRIDPLKGIFVLLEAWKRLRLPQAELWIVGHMLPEVKPRLAPYDGLFRYIPPLSREKLSEVYRQATAFVFPTYVDSFGLVLLEAMASGLPVISTTYSAAPDLLEEGLIPPGDIEALMEAILNFYERPDLADIGKRNREIVESQYTLTRHYFARVREFLEQEGV